MEFIVVGIIDGDGKYQWVIRAIAHPKNFIVARSEHKFDTQEECNENKRFFYERMRQNGFKVIVGPSQSE